MSMPNPSPYADWKRDGLSTLIKLARLLCNVVTSFAGIIRSKYADKPAIIALLTAIELACDALPDAQEEFRAIGSDDPEIPSDPSGLAGINPSAPAAGDPDAGV